VLFSLRRVRTYEDEIEDCEDGSVHENGADDWIALHLWKSEEDAK
jgi:hypothetical protein